MSGRLDRLFRPASIAVVGGGFWCENVIRQCRKMGYEGPIWPIHPTRDTLADERCFRAVAELPSAPDATFVGVNRQATVGVVNDLSEMGAGGAVCFAAGFAEAEAEAEDARELQAGLVAAAGPMPILGPNCYGFINYLDGALLWPDQQGGRRVEKGVAIVTQSSNIAINMTMQARGLPLAYVVTAGNQAQTGLAEIGAGLIADPRVTALGLHIEGVGDVGALERLAAEAAHQGKPIVVMKVGRSESARAATVSHTASLAGSDAGSDALFARLGMARAGSVAVFLETLKLAHVTGPLASARIASMSCSGGEASLMADLAEPLGLDFPVLNRVQHEGLRDALGPMVRLANPLDYNTYIWPDTARMAATFTAMMQGDLALGIVVLDFPRTDRCSDTDWAKVVDAVAQTSAATGRKMAVLASLPETLPERWADALTARGILALSGMQEGLEAVALGAVLGKARAVPPALVLPHQPGPARVLQEAEAKDRLARFGLPLPRRLTADSPEDAARVAAKVGFPVVLKGTGLAHKTEAGAVRLNLPDATAVEHAAREIGSDGFLVEEMIADTVAELLVGVTLDPAHGFLLTIGAGGILTEILADTQNLLLPALPGDIEAALMKLRIAPLLAGYRGKAAADIPAIVAAVMAVQDCVINAGGRIIEAEINPLIARQKGAVAVDALIRIEEDEND